MKKSLSLIAILISAIMVFAPAVYAEDVYTNKDSDPCVIATPVGCTSFKVSFDLFWGEKNLVEGEGGYLDNFLFLYINSTGEAKSLSAAAFRIENSHIQAEPGEVTVDRNAGIVDYGGYTLKNNTSHYVLELANNTLTLTCTSAAASGTISFVYPEGSFDASTPQYLIFEKWGLPYFTVSNLVVESTDYVAETEAPATEAPVTEAPATEAPAPATSDMLISGAVAVALIGAAALLITKKKH